MALAIGENHRVILAITLISGIALGSVFSQALMSVFVGLAMLSYFIYNKNAEKVALFKKEFLVLLPLLLSTVYGILISSKINEGWSEGKTTLNFLCLPFLGLIISYCSLEKLKGILLFGITAEFIWACFNFFKSNQVDYRFHGKEAFNTDAFFCMINIIFFTSTYLKGKKKWKSLVAIIISIAFLALTQNRGSFITILLFLPIIALKYSFKSTKKLLVILTGLVIILTFFSPNNWSTRVSSSLNSIVKESSSSQTASSLGTRYELWKASFFSLKETYGLGTGFGDFRSDLIRFQKHGFIADDLNTLLNLHSIYLHPLMCAGVLGLLGVCLTLFFFVYQQFKLYTNTKSESAFVRLLLMLSLVISGVTDSHLEDSAKIIYFSVFWAMSSLLDKKESLA